ncbi:hypothetical protein ABZP36_021544 [Zizania latifolia]
MAPSRSLLSVVLAVCCYAASAAVAPSSSASSSGDFLQCLAAGVPSQLVITKGSPSFTSVLASSVRNPRFLTPGTVRPLCVVTPTNASHVQTVNAVVAGGGVTSYESGKVWGEKYFGAANFRRLALTKGKVDAGDYFRNEQSIPPLVPTK